MAHRGEDPNKRNFCFLKVNKNNIITSEENIIYTDFDGISTSPIKMFGLLKSCVDRVLRANGHRVQYKGRVVKVTSHEFAPVTLKVVSLDDGEPMKFEVDLVPSLQFGLDILNGNPDVQHHVQALCEEYNVPENERNCMAISLHRADKAKFELDFHDIEQRILYNRGCVKKVIKMVKYLRDRKGGSVSKLRSHLLKTSVMHHVLETKSQYWNNANLEKCFVDTLRRLLLGLQESSITNVFFPSVNLLDRIKAQVKGEISTWLERSVRKYDRTRRVIDIFN